MKRSPRDWAEFGLASAAYVMVLTILQWPVVRTWFEGGNAPAWVQAIGSIGAILVAVWIASRQSAAARSERISLEAIRFEILVRLIVELKNQLDRIVHRKQHGLTLFRQMPTHLAASFEAIHDALGALPLEQAPGGVAMTSLIEARLIARVVKESLAGRFGVDEPAVDDVLEDASKSISLVMDRLTSEMYERFEHHFSRG